MRRNRPPLRSALAASILLASGVAASATMIAVEPPREDDRFEQAYVTANANVRAGPGTNHRVVNRLTRGDFVNVGECRGTWCYVDVHGGNGWLSGRLIGRGQNPYHSLGPADPRVVPPQEPGTWRR